MVEIFVMRSNTVITIRSLHNRSHSESLPAVLDAVDSVEVKPSDVRPG